MREGKFIILRQWWIFEIAFSLMQSCVCVCVCVCVCLKLSDILLVVFIPFSMKEHLDNTRETIDGREHMVNHLETQFSTLEKTLLNMQLRLNKLIQQ